MADNPDWLDVLVLLRKIIHATDLQSKRVVKACGLTIPQVMVLQSIETLGDVTVKRISDEVSLSQATVTTILNRLEEKGLAERSRSTVDKRVVNTRLTPAGKRALRASPPLLHERFISGFERLDAPGRAKILSSLQQMAQLMDAEDIEAASLNDIAASERAEAC